jgi:hypothetical protein
MPQKLWKEARKKIVYPPLPECPIGLSEPAYAHLAFGTHCHVRFFLAFLTLSCLYTLSSVALLRLNVLIGTFSRESAMHVPIQSRPSFSACSVSLSLSHSYSHHDIEDDFELDGISLAADFIPPMYFG